MKLAVVNDDDRFSRRGPGTCLVENLGAFRLHDDLVVNAKLALGHAAQVGLHQYAAGNVRGQHLPLRRHQQVDVFQHVQEELVAPVFYAFPAPADLPGYLGRDLHLFLLALRLDAGLGDERFQHARVAVLRIPKVQYLVQQLVYKHKVVLDVFLVDLAEVRLHHLREPDEELEHHGPVDVLLGDGGQPDIGPADVEERRARDVGDGRPDLLPGVYDVYTERVHGVAADVVPVYAGYEHFAFVVIHEQSPDHVFATDITRQCKRRSGCIALKRY